MADQVGSPTRSTFTRAFLPGLALGVVIGAIGGAFITPLINTDPPPVRPTKGVGEIPPGLIPPPPPDAIDERAPIKPPETPDAAKKDDTKTEPPAPAPK